MLSHSGHFCTSLHFPLLALANTFLYVWVPPSTKNWRTFRRCITYQMVSKNMVKFCDHWNAVPVTQWLVAKTMNTDLTHFWQALQSMSFLFTPTGENAAISSTWHVFGDHKLRRLELGHNVLLKSFKYRSLIPMSHLWANELPLEVNLTRREKNICSHRGPGYFAQKQCIGGPKRRRISGQNRWQAATFATNVRTPRLSSIADSSTMLQILGNTLLSPHFHFIDGLGTHRGEKSVKTKKGALLWYNQDAMPFGHHVQFHGVDFATWSLGVVQLTWATFSKHRVGFELHMVALVPSKNRPEQCKHGALKNCIKLWIALT